MCHPVIQLRDRFEHCRGTVLVSSLCGRDATVREEHFPLPAVCRCTDGAREECMHGYSLKTGLERTTARIRVFQHLFAKYMCDFPCKHIHGVIIVSVFCASVEEQLTKVLVVAKIGP